MKGIVFDRLRSGDKPNEWDGQFAIAALESPGVEVTYQTTFLANGDGHAVWTPFSADGRLANDNTNWVSDSEKLAGAIAVRFTLKPGESRIIPMAIAWDFPTVQFGEGRQWHRHTLGIARGARGVDHDEWIAAFPHHRFKHRGLRGECRGEIRLSRLPAVDQS